MTKFAGLIRIQLQRASQTRFARELQARAQSPRKLLPLMAAFFFGLSLLFAISVYTPAYVLRVEGSELGLVSSREMVETTIVQVEGQIGEILDRDYRMDLSFDYRFTLAPRADLMGYTRLTQELYGLSPEIKAAYILSVDGVEISAAENRAVLDGALASLKERYSTKDTQEVFFANETRVTRKYIPAREPFSTQEDVLEAALSPRQTPQTQVQAVAAVARVYEIGEGSFLGGGDVSESAESDLGSLVSVERTVPQLSVCTIDRLSYPQEVASPVREVPDPTQYEGDTKVLSMGNSGLLWIKSDVTSLNGERLYEDLLSESVLREVEETVIAVGTKERPSYVGTGSFRWPTNGTITSPFGYRYIFGSTSFHTGLDIANRRGTPIYAADNGIVTMAAYKGTYGNIVVLDHGNGYATAYAHCDSLLVSVGQGVMKGEKIATMGTTGRTTGSHCHFEVRVDGVQVDPQKYLP